MPNEDNNIKLSRRRVLGSLGVIGGAAALGGAGTIAGFSDVEEKVAWLEAGEVDLLLDYRSTYKPWGRFNLNPGDPLHDGDFSNTEAIHVVENTDDPDDDVNEDGLDDMTYVVAQAPDYRDTSLEDENGVNPAVSGRDWARLTRTVDGCAFENRADLTDLAADKDRLGGLLDNDLDTDPAQDNNDGSDTSGFINSAGLQDSLAEDVTVDGTPNDIDTYLPGFVDGEVGMQFDLFDIKPLDEGESTISFHVCGNPVTLEVNCSVSDMESPTTEHSGDSDNGINEPEAGAGDTGMNVWANGELDDFIWVQAWHDIDCDNVLDPDTEGDFLIYQGSLAGFIDFCSQQPIRPLGLAFQNAGIGGTTTTNVGNTTGDNTKVCPPGVNPTCTSFDQLGFNSSEVLGRTDVGVLKDEIEKNQTLSDDGPVALDPTVTIGPITFTDVWLKDGEIIGFRFNSTESFDTVIMKGGNGACVYTSNNDLADMSIGVDVDNETGVPAGASGSADGFLFTPLNASGTNAGLSNFSVCLRGELDDGNGIIEIPECIVDPLCIAYQWVLPQDLSDTDTNAPLITLADGSQVPAVYDQLPSDVSGGTLLDEIADKFFGGVVEDVPEDVVNVVQTDSFHYEFEAVAEQCRHSEADPARTVPSK